MVRGSFTRLSLKHVSRTRVLTVLAAVTGAVALALGSAASVHAAPVQATAQVASAAQASLAHAPKPKPTPRPTTVQITGKNVSGKITVQREERPQLFTMLLNEVNWLANARSQTSAPKANKLGPKYTLTVLVQNTATHTYHLYPEAVGGPRAHRPGVGKRADAWFYGRLTMSESLRLSGVPLKEKPDVVNGGVGGGIGEDLERTEVDPVETVASAFAELRRLFLLNVAVLLVIMLGLAGIAFTIRRRV